MDVTWPSAPLRQISFPSQPPAAKSIYATPALESRPRAPLLLNSSPPIRTDRSSVPKRSSLLSAHRAGLSHSSRWHRARRPRRPLRRPNPRRPRRTPTSPRFSSGTLVSARPIALRALRGFRSNQVIPRELEPPPILQDQRLAGAPITSRSRARALPHCSRARSPWTTAFFWLSPKINRKPRRCIRRTSDHGPAPQVRDFVY